MDRNLAPLGIILFSIASTIVGEVLSWLLVYRTSAFKALQENLRRHEKKVEDARATSTSAKNVKKREAKLETWRSEASSRVTGINMRTGFITILVVMASFRLVTMLFGAGPVARLPFVPPPLIQKLTHRGITGADPKECSALFIFILCQGSVKVLTTKLLGLSPGREWSTIKPSMPAGFMSMAGKDK